MWIIRMRTFLFLFTLAVAFCPTFAEDRRDLTALRLPHTTITLTEAVAAGGFTLFAHALPTGPPVDYRSLPAFCRVAAASKPTGDSDIRFEVWMPLGNWIMMVGSLLRPLHGHA